MDYLQSMNCVQCVRKHLANALSYAKEVLAGHGEGGDPDHRPDLLGELGNAEHHLIGSTELSYLQAEILQIRREVEENNHVPTAEHVTRIRTTWVRLDGVDPAFGRQRALPSLSTYHAPPPQLGDRINKGPEVAINQLPQSRSIKKLAVIFTEGENKLSLETRNRMARVFLSGVPFDVVKRPDKDKYSHYLFWPDRTGLVRGWNVASAKVMRTSGARPYDSAPLLMDSAWFDQSSVDDSIHTLEDLHKAVPDSEEVLMDVGTILPAGIKDICCSVKRRLTRKAVLVNWQDDDSLEALIKYLDANSQEWRDNQ